MTEDEAKTKWCPMVMVASSGGAYNRNSLGGIGYIDTKDIHCIGSQCMMWREYKEKFIGYIYDELVITNKPEGGYCGLAGKP